MSADASNTPERAPADTLPPAARRALAEAAERRRQAEREPAGAREFGGRLGPDPVRYGDYEKDGIAVDF